MPPQVPQRKYWTGEQTELGDARTLTKGDKEARCVLLSHLLERKRRLLRIMPTVECRLLYLDLLHERGGDLFRVACERDLEGIVGKWARGTYRTDGRATSWLKIESRLHADARSARAVRLAAIWPA
jgi:ATP-dependent DNA ligase